MYDPKSPDMRPLNWIAPGAGAQTKTNALPSAVGGFQLSSIYSGNFSQLSRRQFTGKATIDLHDPDNGQAAVAMADVGLMSLAYIRSTGHDVVLTEMQRPNLLVVLAGKLMSRNEQTRVECNSEPWVLFGRGKRKTRVIPPSGADYEAFVLSLPPSFLGSGLTSLEAAGGIIAGDASVEDDVQLARLMRAIGSQLTLLRKTDLDRRLAEAWTAILVEQLNRCVATRVGAVGRDMPDDVHELTLSHVLRAEKMIYERPDEVAGVQDIAHHIGVSERTLQAAFRKVRSATPTQVLARAKLHRARRALLDPAGPDSVSSVCRMCGVEHHGRFSKVYKEAFGESPVATLNSRRAR